MQLTPATVATGCECSDPNNPTNKLPCSLQPDGECKISGNDGWGKCAPECCKKDTPEGYSNMIENYSPFLINYITYNNNIGYINIIIIIYALCFLIYP